MCSKLWLWYLSKVWILLVVCIQECCNLFFAFYIIEGSIGSKKLCICNYSLQTIILMVFRDIAAFHVSYNSLIIPALVGFGTDWILLIVVVSFAGMSMKIPHFQSHVVILNSCIWNHVLSVASGIWTIFDMILGPRFRIL